MRYVIAGKLSGSLKFKKKNYVNLYIDIISCSLYILMILHGGIRHSTDSLTSSDEYITYESQVKDHYENRKTKKLEDAIRKHETYVRRLIKDQANEYAKLENFFNGNCETTQIFQLKYCVDYLTHGLDIPIIEAKCEENPFLKQLRESLYCSILSVTANPESNYLYGPTIRIIMKIIDFYDIFIRTIKPTPAYYHKYRYERYVEYCISLANEGLFVFPTFAYIGATDLLKLRSYPIFAVGLNITLNYVDEYFQTPVEFFVHDINHTRRMFESNLDDMKKRGININDMNVRKQYYAESKVCLEEVLYILGNTLEQRPTSKTNVETITIPQITQKGEVKKTEVRHLKLDDYSDVDHYTPIDTGYAQIIKIILFEITHEDAMPMQKDVICSSILRNSGIETAFPRVDKSARITIDIEKGGSILGFVKYKVRNGFFDSVKTPLEAVAKYFYRPDKQITIATQILLKKLCRTAVSNGSPDHDRIIINITDKVGLNLPVHDDVVSYYVPEILLDPIFGDFSEEYIDTIRNKNGIKEPNEFTGNRPKPITEQEGILKKLGGNKKTRKNMRNCNN
jgi:hypothetical protein